MTKTHPSRWHETRAMLTDLLAWLDATQEWAETMVSDAEAHPDASVLPAQSEGEPTADPNAELVVRPDLFALLAAMTALRQEVTLQTRSARSDREQATQTLDQLSLAVTEMAERSQDDEPEVDHVGVDALVALHDALSRAERQGHLLIAETVNTLREWGRHTERQDRPSIPEPSPEPQPRRWFKRRRREPIPSPTPASISPHDPETDQREALLHQIGRDAAQMANRLDGLSAGYELGLQRLERLLAECGIEPIDCIGKSVDAELMEVVQVVTDVGHPDGAVVDEVRRGYRRDGQVYRFAQVVAARIPSPEVEAPLTEDSNTHQEVD